MVVREQEWLDSDVTAMLELAQVESDSCPGCGWHESFIDDDANDFAPKDRKCPVCAGKAQWERRHHALDETWNENHKDAPAMMPRPADGRWTSMTLLSPEEAEKLRGGSGGD